MFARSADEPIRPHGSEQKAGGAGTSGSCQGRGGGAPTRNPSVRPQPHKESRNVRAKRGRAETAAWCETPHNSSFSALRPSGEAAIKKRNPFLNGTGCNETARSCYITIRATLFCAAAPARCRRRATPSKAATLRAAFCAYGVPKGETLGGLCPPKTPCQGTLRCSIVALRPIGLIARFAPRLRVAVSATGRAPLWRSAPSAFCSELCNYVSSSALRANIAR